MLTEPYGNTASLRNPNQIADGLKLARPELMSHNTEITKIPGASHCEFSSVLFKIISDTEWKQ